MSQEQRAYTNPTGSVRDYFNSKSLNGRGHVIRDATIAPSVRNSELLASTLASSESISANNLFTSPKIKQQMTPSASDDSGRYFGSSDSLYSLSTSSSGSLSRASGSEDNRDCTDPVTNYITGSEENLELYATSRYTHVQDRNGHCVVTGREGKLVKCENEV